MNNADQIKKAYEDLKEKMQLISNVAKIGFWEYNKKNGKINLSDETLKITGLDQSSYSLSEMLNLIFDKNKADVIHKLFIANIEKEENIDEEYTFTHPGDYRKVSVRMVTRIQENKKLITGIIQDITERKISEELLKKAKDKAEEADMLKSAFLANMSHEIRTPLNAILGFSRLLTEAELNDQQKKEYSEYISGSAENLLNLIQDIIDVSKIEAGKIEIEKTQCFINRKLKEIKATFEKEKQHKNKEHIQLILKTPVKDENFAIKTDPFRFTQIFSNLVGNALKFIEKGTIEFGYVIPNKDFLQFYVKDTGIGIPIDKRDLVFSRFGQVVNKQIKNPGGTGLGLSITKHLVEKLGGEIWYESELNKGTTFYFTLPFDELKNHYEIEKKDSNQNTEIKKRLKILAVEDDRLNMILLKDLLSAHAENIILDEAKNGIQALQKLKTNKYDLILMDVRMPEMDGYETSRYIREKLPEPVSQIPILGLSANAVKEEIEKGKEAGMNDLLAKPIDPDLLLNIIAKLTQNHTEKIKENDKKNDFNSINTEIVRIDFFKQLFKNDQKKIAKTLKAYIKEIPIQIETLFLSFNEKDYEMLKITAHSMKSTFHYIGRNDLSDLCKKIEQNIDQNNFNEKILRKELEQISYNWKLIDEELKNILQD